MATIMGITIMRIMITHIMAMIITITPRPPATRPPTIWFAIRFAA